MEGILVVCQICCLEDTRDYRAIPNEHFQIQSYKINLALKSIKTVEKSLMV
jgi:hypothetical protein